MGDSKLERVEDGEWLSVSDCGAAFALDPRSARSQRYAMRPWQSGTRAAVPPLSQAWSLGNNRTVGVTAL